MRGKTKREVATKRKSTSRSLRSKPLWIDLTAKEMSCLRSICSGKSLKKIADENGHTISTVQTRLRRIMGKLDVGNRVDLILISASLGLIPCPCRNSRGTPE